MLVDSIMANQDIWLQYTVEGQTLSRTYVYTKNKDISFTIFSKTCSTKNHVSIRCSCAHLHSLRSLRWEQKPLRAQILPTAAGSQQRNNSRAELTICRVDTVAAPPAAPLSNALLTTLCSPFCHPCCTGETQKGIKGTVRRFVVEKSQL